MGVVDARFEGRGKTLPRTDIQALRGLAVLLVLFYHAGIGNVAAGYLGVDVFFVISGFLITGLVKDAIERSEFSFSSFYFRRAKRLLPAAYATFAATALLAPLFLTQGERQDFRSQLIGALTFTANIALWRQSGYFGGASELKPLLHIWSLSLEEQYYFLLPAAMFLFPRRLWKPVVILAVLGSFLACMVMIRIRPTPTFYLLPTRGWELALGSAGALIGAHSRSASLIRWAFWPSVGSLLIIPLLEPGDYRLGFSTLIVCLATLVVILRAHPKLESSLAMAGLAWVGTRSYSLYLVHWPLFAFLNNAWIGEAGVITPPLRFRFGLILLSFLLAFMLNRFVEEPVRRSSFRVAPRFLAVVVTCTMAIFLVGWWTTGRTTEKDFAEIRRINYGLGVSCESGSHFAPDACQTSLHPTMLVWGDSIAMHLVPGLVHESAEGTGIVQATQSICGPLLGVATIENGYSRQWAKDCISFNDSVLLYLKGSSSIQTVVLSSPFGQFLGGALLKRDDSSGDFITVKAGIPEAVAGLRRTVLAVRAAGKKVVVVAPPPNGGFDVGRCLERKDTGLVILGRADNCQISRASHTQLSSSVLALLAAIPSQVDVAVLSFDALLCDVNFCKTQAEGTYIYRDMCHFSHAGSVWIAKEFRLNERILSQAR